MSQKITFDLTCGCGAKNQYTEAADAVAVNRPLATSCSQCGTTIVLLVTRIDKENVPPVDYTVKFYKTDH